MSLKITLGTRTGITLLEVTIATFVMAIGLLGVASLLPVGLSEMSGALQADRSAALGRSAFRDLLSQRWLAPQNWLQSPTATTATPVVTAATANAPPSMPNGPFVLDPLMFAMNQGTASALSALTTLPYNVGSPSGLAIQRITVRAYPDTTNNTTIPLAVSDRLFRSNDDVVFTVPTDKTYKPLPTRQYGNNATFSTNTNPNLNWVNHATNGAFSWLAIVAPDPVESGKPGVTAASGPAGFLPGNPFNTQRFSVTVVVFNSRNFVVPISSPPPVVSERPATIDFSPSGISSTTNYAGEALLSAPTKVPTTVIDDYLKVKPEQWLLVLSPNSDIYHGGANLTNASWYRVVSAAQALNSKNQRAVRLVGPSWTSLSAGSPWQGTCILLDGVVGVYEKTFITDGHSPYTPN